MAVVGDYFFFFFFNGCSPLPREISRVRIKFEIGIRVLEAEVIEFEIVFQTSLSPSLSLFYPFKYHLFRVRDREFLFLIIRKIFFNRVIINYSIRVDERISPERKRVIYFPLISLLPFLVLFEEGRKS